MRRLLDVKAAAAYLGISAGMVRSYVGKGVLTPVRPPSARGRGEGRRLLFDVLDLDRVIDGWKAASTIEPNAQLSAAAIKGWRQTPDRRRASAS